jgi:hypothetical protein
MPYIQSVVAPVRICYHRYPGAETLDSYMRRLDEEIREYRVQLKPLEDGSMQLSENTGSAFADVAIPYRHRLPGNVSQATPSDD